MRLKNRFILSIIFTVFNIGFFFAIMFIMPYMMEHEPTNVVIPVTITFTFLLSVYVNIYYFIELLFSIVEKEPKTILKKRIIKIIIAICAIILIEFLFEPYFFYQSLYIYVKNSFIFLNLLIIIYYIGKIIYDLIFKRYSVSPNRKKVINVYFLISVIFLLLLISNLHLYYINHYTIPPLYGCSYYDTDLNLIYNSQYEGSCPDLENLTVTDTKTGSDLSFTVNEQVYHTEHNGNKKHRYTINSNISYLYDSEGRVTDYTIETFNRSYDYHSNSTVLTEEVRFYKQILNTYEEDTFTSLHTILKSNNTDDQSDIVTSRLEYKSHYTQKTSKEAKVQVIVEDLNQSNNTKPLYDISIWDLGEPEYYITRLSDNQKLTIYHFMNNEIQKHFNNGVPKEVYNMRDQLDSEIYLKVITHNNNKSYYSHEFGNRITMASKDGTYHISSILLKTDYGYILKHYNHKRDRLGRYYEYDGIYSTTETIPLNSLSIPLQSINDYSNNLFYMSESSLIYQKNPLIFEE